LSESLTSLIAWVRAHPYLIIPLFFSLGMAWRDVHTHRIPNLLNLFCALSGLGYQLGARGLGGLGDGLLGLLLGFVLMIGFYVFGSMGAGDVKALAALGTWLGPWNTLLLFIFMGLSGLPLVIFSLWYQGRLWIKIQMGWSSLINLARSSTGSHPRQNPTNPRESFPYAVAIASGMVLLCAFSKTIEAMPRVLY